jgi:uncharacterized cupin superfamily protein
MKKWAQAAGILAWALYSAAASTDEPTKPTKVAASQAVGPIFAAPGAQHDNRFGPMSNVKLLSSKDKRFTAGLFKASAGDFPIDAYPQDEFCYFLSGSVKLTSADGSVLELEAGDAVVIPKGWKGRWTTPGYSKYYTVYDTSK